MEALEPYWTNPYVFIVGCPQRRRRLNEIETGPPYN
jgi:hypothetical protein